MQLSTYNIHQRSDYIIGSIAPAIGPNKSKKLTRLVALAHNISSKDLKKNNIHGFTERQLSSVKPVCIIQHFHACDSLCRKGHASNYAPFLPSSCTGCFSYCHDKVNRTILYYRYYKFVLFNFSKPCRMRFVTSHQNCMKCWRQNLLRNWGTMVIFTCTALDQILKWGEGLWPCLNMLCTLPL